MYQSSPTSRQSGVLPVLVALAVAFTLAATLTIVGTARAAVVTLTAELTAEAEVPDPGPEGATGTASITMDDETGEVCFELTIDGLDDEDAVVAAHIHTGEAGVAGDVVVPLFTEPPTGEMTGCVEDVELELVAAIIADPSEYYVNIHSELFPAGAVRGQLALQDDGGAGTATVMVMKHNCANVTTTAQFEAVEARAATNPLTPDAAFGTTVETVLECPTVVLPGDAQTAGAVAGGESSFDFEVTDADGTAVLSADGVYAMSAACETDVEYDADRSGALDAGVCLDLSHYAFEVTTDAQVTVAETAPPSGTIFGALRFTPGSGDEAALVSAGDGQVVLDVAADEDGMIMLHVYNFAVAAAPAPTTPAPTPAPTQGAMPDTAVPGTSGLAGAALAVVLVALTSASVLAVSTRRIRG